MGNTPPQQQQPPKPAPSNLPAPLRTDEIRVVEPKEGFKVSISLAHINSQGGQTEPMWCFVTDGLRSKNQQEIIVLLQQEPEREGLSYPTQILDYLSLVWQCACQGLLVHDGCYTELGGNFLSSPDNAGFVYTAWRSQIPKGDLPVEDPMEYLYAVLVKKGEMEWAKHMSTRLLLRLGHYHRFFPCPLWGRRNRPSQFNGIGQSVIVRTPMLYVEGIFVQKEASNVIRLRLPKDKHEELVSDFASVNNDRSVQDLMPITLLASINTQADSHLICVPGSNQPTATAAPGSTGQRLGGSFLTFLPLDQVNGAVSLVEDGWMVHMLKSVYWELRDAITKKEGFTYTHEGSPVFILEWYDRQFTNPITGETITASSGWTTYEPQGGRRKDDEQQIPIGSINLSSVTLLTEDSTLGQRIAAKNLADFVQVLCKFVETTHQEWTDKNKNEEKREEEKKEDEKEKETEKEEGKKKEEKVTVIEVLRQGEVFVLQVEMNPSGKVIFKATIEEREGGEESPKQRRDQWMEYMLSHLQSHFDSDEGQAAIPAVTEGSIAFLLHFQQQY